MALITTSIERMIVNKILLGIDLSETSLNALRIAVAVATRNKASLELINVSENIHRISNRRTVHPSDFANPEVLSALESSLSQDNIATNLVQVKGNVVEEILSHAATIGADLIVIGTHGASGMREGYMGSNAYRIIKYASCPVLAIPPKCKVASFQKAMYPVLPLGESWDSFDIACKLLAEGGELDVLGLTTLKMQRQTGVLDDLVQKITSNMQCPGINIKTTWAKGGSVSEEIISFARNAAPDVVILTPVIDAIARADFIGPHTQRLLHTLRTPILCIRSIHKLHANPGLEPVSAAFG